MEKELYIIDSKLDSNDDKSWAFLGAFKTSNEASAYYDGYHKYKKNLSTIVPLDLPEEWESYFDKFIYCHECDKYPYNLDDRCVFLVQQKHKESWHFKCVLPTEGTAKTYIAANRSYNKEVVVDYRIVTLKLPYHKNQLREKISLERHNKSTLIEKKYYDKINRNEIMDKTYKLVEKHDILLKALVGLYAFNVVINVLQFIF